MNYRACSGCDAVDGALRTCVENVLRTSPARWSLALRNGKLLHASAVLGDEWLSLTAPLRLDIAHGVPWRLLESNALLPRAARLTLQPRSGSASVRVDVRVRTNAPPTTSVTTACAALQEAVSVAEACTAREHAPPVHCTRAERSVTAERLRELLAESGWSHQEQPGGGISIDIGCHGAHLAASADHDAGAFRCGLRLGTVADIPPLCREAVAVLLLTVTDALPLVRAAASAANAEDGVQLEAAFAAEPTADDMRSTLDALAAACAHTVREAPALLDPATAATYLRVYRGAACADTGAAASRAPEFRTTVKGG